MADGGKGLRVGGQVGRVLRPSMNLYMLEYSKLQFSQKIILCNITN